MNPDEIFEKTAKGIEEVEKRTYRLDFRHRAALIQVDGRSTAEAMLARIPGNAESCLLDLWRDGFIASVEGHAFTDAEAAAAQHVPGAGFDLQEAKASASRKIESLLGPDGDAMAMRIEGVKTIAEFTTQAERTRTIVEQLRGAAAGKEFWSATGL